jgi:hypothetical protein
LIQQDRYFLPDLEKIELSDEQMASFEVEHIPPAVLLFPSGYLTIEKSFQRMGAMNYLLRASLLGRDYFRASSTSVALAVKNVRYPIDVIRKTVIVTAPRIPIIIPIWYRIAKTGELPARICPVIIPGRNTMPIPIIALIVGRIAAVNASWAYCLAAAAGVAPSIRAVSIFETLARMLDVKRSYPKAIPVMELPISIPVIGIKYCGRYHGSTARMTNRKKRTDVNVPRKREPIITIRNRRGVGTFTRAKTLWIANPSIIRKIAAVIHGFGLMKTHSKIYPTATNCTVIRTVAIIISAVLAIFHRAVIAKTNATKIYPAARRRVEISIASFICVPLKFAIDKL